jgi:hypothetical protein
VAKENVVLEKHEVVERLRAQLHLGSSLRSSAGDDPGKADMRRQLRRWQSERLARTHADFLTSPRYRGAALFFLSDLYGPQDHSERYVEAERVLPLMVRMLPVTALAAVADAVELDTLCESLDADMVAVLGPRLSTLDEPAYADAYRQTGRARDREQQVALIRDLGSTMDHLAQLPFVGTALRRMNSPAKIFGLGQLQNFLERGFDAFSAMKGADEFVRLIVERETRLSRGLFAGDDRLLDHPATAWDVGTNADVE